MSKQILGFSLSRHAIATALLLVLGACNPAETHSSGVLEILADRSPDAGYEASVRGQLRLEGVVDASIHVVSGNEVLQSRVIRRELPVGLYSVSWESSADDTRHSGAEWSLSGPDVVSVFPDRVTRLLVHPMTPERALAALDP